MTTHDYFFIVTILAALFVVASLFIFTADMVFDWFNRRRR